MIARSLTTQLLLALLVSSTAAAQQSERIEVPLWPGGAPGSEGTTGPEKVRVTDGGDQVVSSIHRPSITSFLPTKETATGAAIVIASSG